MLRGKPHMYALRTYFKSLLVFVNRKPEWSFSFGDLCCTDTGIFLLHDSVVMKLS